MAVTKQDKIIIGTAIAVIIGLFALGIGIQRLSSEPTSAAPPQDLTKPPSQREASDLDESGSNLDESEFIPVSCVFSGAAQLDPGIHGRLFEGSKTSEQSMTLAPESAFACEDKYGRSSGTSTLNADFEALSLFNGVGQGPGTITWRELPAWSPLAHGESGFPSTVTDGAEAEGEPTDEATVSQTTSEIELLFPSIIVWITILDGPYGGFNGKIVLEEWDLVYDDNEVIVEIQFRPTRFILDPVA